jgi:hypothetical protein
MRIEELSFGGESNGRFGERSKAKEALCQAGGDYG